MGADKQVVLVAGSRSAQDAAGLLALLAKGAFRADFCDDPPDLITSAAGGAIGGVVLDLRVRPEPALDLLRGLRQHGVSAVPVVAVLPRGEVALRRTAVELGADDALPVADAEDEAELLLRVERLVSRARQLAALTAEVESLRLLSVTDALTGCHNHRFFQERLREEFRRAQRHDDALSLVLLDIDHFKDVNDRFGHPVGDGVLRDVAEAIRQSVRDTDLVSRYGGEEFAVLLPRTPISGALTVADRIWRGVGAVRAGPRGEVRVTVSLGLAAFPGRQVVAADTLLRTADDALYRAKRDGRNRICVHPQVSFYGDGPAHTG